MVACLLGGRPRARSRRGATPTPDSSPPCVLARGGGLHAAVGEVLVGWAARTCGVHGTGAPTGDAALARARRGRRRSPPWVRAYRGSRPQCGLRIRTFAQRAGHGPLKRPGWPCTRRICFAPRAADRCLGRVSCRWSRQASIRSVRRRPDGCSVRTHESPNEDVLDALALALASGLGACSLYGGYRERGGALGGEAVPGAGYVVHRSRDLYCCPRCVEAVARASGRT